MSCHANHGESVTSNRRTATNASDIEQQFLNEMKRRFRRLRGLVRRTVGYQNDALNLSSNAEEREAFDYPTDWGKIRAFVRWVRQAIQEEILEPVNPADVQAGNHWTSRFLDSAFVAGVNQSTGLLFQQGASIENIPDSQILNRPVFASSLRRLYTRTYSNLQDITDDTADVIREELTQGFAEGVNPKEMARRITKEVRDIQHTRAETLARSETMNTHSEAALDNYERVGVNVVNHVEWGATDGPRTCPFCRRLDGVALTIEEMRSGAVRWRDSVFRLSPPAHPNGRCFPKPAIGGEVTNSLQDRLNANFNNITVLSGA